MQENQERVEAEIEEKLTQKFQEELQTQLEAKAQEVASQKEKVENPTIRYFIIYSLSFCFPLLSVIPFYNLHFLQELQEIMEDTQSRAHTQAKVEAEELFQKQRQVKKRRKRFYYYMYMYIKKLTIIYVHV